MKHTVGHPCASLPTTTTEIRPNWTNRGPVLHSGFVRDGSSFITIVWDQEKRNRFWRRKTSFTFFAKHRLGFCMPSFPQWKNVMVGCCLTKPTSFWWVALRHGYHYGIWNTSSNCPETENFCVRAHAKVLPGSVLSIEIFFFSWTSFNIDYFYNYWN